MIDAGFRPLIVLNDHVREVLKTDFHLFLVFAGMHGRYDDEIHPLHNPDWVKGAQKHEAATLLLAQRRLEHLRKIYPTWNGS
jgi:hypothetical protein